MGKSHDKLRPADGIKVERAASSELRSSESGSLRRSRDSKRTRFLPSWFGSDHSLRSSSKIPKDALECQDSLPSLFERIESMLDSLGATYVYSKRRNKIKVRLNHEGKTAKFSVNVSSKGGDEADGPAYFVFFSRRGGDKEAFQTTVSQLRKQFK